MEVQQVRFCPGRRHVDGGFFWFQSPTAKEIILCDIHAIHYNRNSYINSRLQKRRTTKRRATVPSIICNLLFENSFLPSLNITS